MPIGLGLASSHGGAVGLKSVEDWQEYYAPMKDRSPQPPHSDLETPEVLQDYIGRNRRAFDTLRDQLAAYKAELLIIIGGDQMEMFDHSNVPNLMMYFGETASGYNSDTMAMRRAPQGQGRQYKEEDLVRLDVDVKTSEWLLNKLVAQEGFDVAMSTEQMNLGRPGMGMPHAFHRPVPMIMPELNIPVITLYENTYQPPSLSASRCYEFGRTLAQLLKNDPRRIAIYGSGGLSHDPGGPRSGWVDEELDAWFMQRLAEGDGKALAAMFGFDSMTMRGGTGETRAWITVAGAMEEMGARATILDYLPASHALHGMGYAYWPELAAVPADG